MLLVGKQRWFNGGAPTKCARCREDFNGVAVHSHRDGKYYCSDQCKEWAETETVEDRARKLQ